MTTINTKINQITLEFRLNLKQFNFSIFDRK